MTATCGQLKRLRVSRPGSRHHSPLQTCREQTDLVDEFGRLRYLEVKPGQNQVHGDVFPGGGSDVEPAGVVINRFNQTARRVQTGGRDLRGNPKPDARVQRRGTPPSRQQRKN